MAALGVAWPSMAGDLGRPLPDLSVLILAHVTGYLAVALTTGEMARRIGFGALLSVASGIGAVSLGGVAAVPGWGWIVGSMVLLGVSGGAIDAGLNAYVAVAHRSNAMGLLHAGFGIGAVLGPLLVTALLAADLRWEAAFLIAAVVQAIVTVALMASRSEFDHHRPPPIGPRARPSGRRSTLIMSLLVFALYAGVEVGAGAWAYSLFTEGRGLDAAAAGLMVSCYWGALTISRVLLGVTGDRGHPRTLLIGSAVLGAVGLGLLWWNPASWAGPVGLVVTGLALGPYFPMQMLLTPARFGPEFMPWMSGYQLAAASLGAALVPGGIGLVVGVAGLESVAVILGLAAVALVVATMLLDRPIPAELIVTA